MGIPRFTLRTLAVVVTLVCFYFGAWEATKRHGVNDVESSPAPLLVYGYQYESPFDVEPLGRQYSVWLFGLKFKLPFKTESLPRDLEFFWGEYRKLKPEDFKRVW